jgi:hypothetical protein
MPYYYVNVENNHVGISLLGGAQEAIIECKNEDFRHCKICHVDYRAVDDTIGTWGGDPKRWKIKDVFNNLPDSHVFNVGDKVRLKNLVDVHPAIKHVYDGLNLGKTYTINLIHYYSGWSNETYSVVGVESGYEGWIPQEFFELYVEKKVVDVDDEVDLGGPQPKSEDNSPFKPGDSVWVHNYPGSGIPHPLDRIEQVTIIDPNRHHEDDASGSYVWTHLVLFQGRILRLDNDRAKFSYYHPKYCTSTLRERYPYGGTIFAGSDREGNGLPDNCVTVKIVNPRHVNDIIKGLLSTNEWDHIVEYKGSYYRINTRTAFGAINPCKEIPLPEYLSDTGGTAMKIAMDSTHVSSAGYCTGEYPFYSSTETTTSIMYPQIPSEAYQTSQSKLKALKQQKPITLKTKKSWK